jgi:hypothetical protein
MTDKVQMYIEDINKDIEACESDIKRLKDRVLELKNQRYKLQLQNIPHDSAVAILEEIYLKANRCCKPNAGTEVVKFVLGVADNPQLMEWFGPHPE